MAFAINAGSYVRCYVNRVVPTDEPLASVEVPARVTADHTLDALSPRLLCHVITCYNYVLVVA